MSDYPKFAPISRRYRDITITEKIDGTNGLISIHPSVVQVEIGEGIDYKPVGPLEIRAGSRNRWLTVDDDNFGFAKWVEDNKETLIADLGEGDHYGEWWGSGIQRGYGLTNGEKRFSLFNTKRWGTSYDFTTPQLEIVPILLLEVANWDSNIDLALHYLRVNGSKAEPDYMNPEGIVIWHDQGRFYEKVTLENDGIPKSKVAP
jgi:hypothetical protein